MSCHLPIRTTLTALSIGLAIIAGAHARTYQITDLGTLPAGADAILSTSTAGAINSKGDVSGVSADYVPGGVRYRGFLWKGGVLQPVDNSATTRDSFALDLNDAGQVVGYTSTGSSQTPFLFAPSAGDGAFTSLPTLNPPGSELASGIATAINNGGMIGGRANAPAANGRFGGSVPASFSIGAATELPALPSPPGYAPSAGVNALNNFGIAAGVAQAFDSLGQLVGYHAVTIHGTTVRDLGTINPGNRGESFASDINDARQVVGYAQRQDADGNDLGPRAVLWDGERAIDLGTLGPQPGIGPVTGTAFTSGYSSASGLNMNGQIVGKSLAFDGAGVAIGDRAFIHENGAMTDLNTMIDPASGWVITSASGINDAGQIAATASGSVGARAVLLTPVLDAGEMEAYPRTMMAGRSTRMTIAVGGAAKSDRTVNLWASSVVFDMPKSVILPAGSKRVSFVVKTNGATTVQRAAMFARLDGKVMRTEIRAVPTR